MLTIKLLRKQGKSRHGSVGSFLFMTGKKKRHIHMHLFSNTNNDRLFNISDGVLTGVVGAV